MFRKKVSSLSSFIQKTFTEHLYVTDTMLEDVTKKWIGSTCKSWEAHDLLRKQTTYERVLEKYELPRMRTDLSREITTGLILENEVSPLHGDPALFHTTGHWGESPRHHSDLHISHQEFHPQYILITYLWTCDTGHEDLEMCCSDLPSRTLPLVAGSAPVGNLQPPELLGVSLCAMTHPGGGIKAWPVDMSGQPWRAIFTPEPSRVS